MNFASEIWNKPAAAAAAADDVVTKSVRFNGGDSPILTRTPSSSGSQTTFTLSFWVKRSDLNSTGYETIWASEASGYNYTLLTYYTDGLRFQSHGLGATPTLQSNAVFRDVSAWYHIVLSVDTTQATDTNRVKIYVNGSAITFSSATYPTLNYDLQVNTSSYTNKIGLSSGTGQYFDGYLADVHFIDGQALTPTSFAEEDATTGQWKPKAFSGTYGTNGFHLDFEEDSATGGSNAGIGKDVSGNGNYFDTTNLAASDVVEDTPTDNYCVLNAVDIGGGTLSEGNLAFVAGGAHRAVKATQAFPPSSKRYFEVLLSNSFSNPPAIGIMSDTAKVSDQINATQSRFLRGNGYTHNNGSEIASGYTSWASGDIIGLQIDTTANTLKFRINDGSWTTAFSDLSGHTWLPCLKSYDGAHKLITNFGQDPFFAGGKTSGQDTSQSEFFYAPPSGFSALSTGNLATPTIAKPSEHFMPVTYTGASPSDKTVTGVGFQADLTWIKSRNQTYNHALYDSVRGATKELHSNTSDVEDTDANGLKSWNSDGFVVGSDGEVGDVTGTRIAWNWLAGTSFTAESGVSDSGSKNVDAGFSIVTWTGNDDGTGASPTPQAVSHGLTVAPELIIAKSRTQNTFHNFNWVVWHKDLTSGKYLLLNGLGVETGWGDALVSSIGSSSVTFGSDASMGGEDLNADSFGGADTYVAYLFASVAGYSKVDFYIPNGSVPGVFVHLGFRPAFILIKCTDGAGRYWCMKDAVRSTTYNPADGNLYANANLSEDTTSTVDIDFLSNGFRINGNYAGINTSGLTYIYYAVAESPFKYANAR